MYWMGGAQGSPAPDPAPDEEDVLAPQCRCPRGNTVPKGPRMPILIPRFLAGAAPLGDVLRCGGSPSGKCPGPGRGGGDRDGASPTPVSGDLHELAGHMAQVGPGVHADLEKGVDRGQWFPPASGWRVGAGKYRAASGFPVFARRWWPWLFPQKFVVDFDRIRDLRYAGADTSAAAHAGQFAHFFRHILRFPVKTVAETFRRTVAEICPPATVAKSRKRQPSQDRQRVPQFRLQSTSSCTSKQ